MVSHDFPCKLCMIVSVCKFFLPQFSRHLYIVKKKIYSTYTEILVNKVFDSQQKKIYIYIYIIPVYIYYISISIYIYIVCVCLTLHGSFTPPNAYGRMFYSRTAQVAICDSADSSITSVGLSCLYTYFCVVLFCSCDVSAVYSKSLM